MVSPKDICGDRFDKATAKRDLLLCLAQRGRGRAFVAGINLSPGNEICPGWSARRAVR
jgi:hypothetical protein